MTVMKMDSVELLPTRKVASLPPFSADISPFCFGWMRMGEGKGVGVGRGGGEFELNSVLINLIPLFNVLARRDLYDFFSLQPLRFFC